MHGTLRTGLACVGLMALSGCGTSIWTLRVPLDAATTAPTAQGGTVHIDDQRPAKGREVHTGGGLFRCERWYGDETYIPTKVEYLRQLLQSRVASGATLQVRLDRLDTIELCENTANRGAAAAAAGAGAIYISPHDVPGGDSMWIHVSGTANDRTFAVSRGFDYSMRGVRFTELPAASPEYLANLRKAFGEIADEIVRASIDGESKALSTMR